MVQLLQPLLILLLIFTLMIQPKGVKSFEYANYATVMDIKNSLQRDHLKEIWNTDYIKLVEQTDLGLLKTKNVEGELVYEST